VQRAFEADNAICGIEHPELRQKLTVVITSAAESVYLHTTDWNTYPLPQHIIIQEREQEALYSARDAAFDNVNDRALAQHEDQSPTTSPPAEATSSPNTDLEKQVPSPEPKKAVYNPSWGVVCHFLVALPALSASPIVGLTMNPPLHTHKGAVFLIGYFTVWATYVGTHWISDVNKEPHVRAVYSGNLVLCYALLLALFLGPFGN
jgi:hypothetical protein